MMRPKVFHGTYSMICANSVLPTFIPHSRFVKPGMIAKAQYEIQIVDTHESLETLIIVGVAVGTSQFNRTLVIFHTDCADGINLGGTFPYPYIHSRSATAVVSPEESPS